MPTAPTAYTPTAEPVSHHVRARQLLKAHPEVKRLMTRNATTALITAGCVAVQVAMTYLLHGHAWYWSLAASYLLGLLCAIRSS
ncbi:hypothetical protein [Hymenobacter sp. BRD67]|uniref:hypothetical protein n=1 Tax=Hymenobacter sp. BRD67 TaxID=2675877 RepID=UPI001565E123|nr:hypothetical protein [Hymenobacter sp. BRD67]QKG52435.1 hypothetical protein GKZ67_07230 [Hymenobacter sp. BRD67]